MALADKLAHDGSVPERLQHETGKPQVLAEGANHAEEASGRGGRALLPAAVDHAAKVVRLGRVPGLCYALEHLGLALRADLGVLLLKALTVPVEVALPLVVLGVVGVVREVLRQRAREYALVLEACGAEDVA